MRERLDSRLAEVLATAALTCFVKAEGISEDENCHAGMKVSIPLGCRRVSNETRIVWVLQSFRS